MEPTAGAWSADEPTLDFSGLATPTGRERGNTDARAEATRGRAAGDAATPSWNPLASVGATAAADAQSAAAALISAPHLWSETPALVWTAPAVDAKPVPAWQTAAAAVTPVDHALEIATPAATPTTDAAPSSAPEPSLVAADAAAPVAATQPIAHALARIDPHAAASPEIMTTVTLPAPDAPTSVTRDMAGKAYASSTTTYASDGAVVSVDLYGFARTFDHVRLDYRADGTLATRTLLDTEHPAAAIVIDYDEAGAPVARHEIDLPNRPYARVDIRYDTEGAVAERTRSGFATGDVASITVRFDAHGAIVEVQHLQLDGSRTTIGTSSPNTLAGHGGDLLVGHGGADTFVLLDAGPHPLAVADFHQSQGDHIDLSHLLAGGLGHSVGDAAFDGHAGAVRFERVDGGVLVSVDIDGDKIGDASVLLAGAHLIAPTDLIF